MLIYATEDLPDRVRSTSSTSCLASLIRRRAFVNALRRPPSVPSFHESGLPRSAASSHPSDVEGCWERVLPFEDDFRDQSLDSRRRMDLAIWANELLRFRLELT